MQAKSSFTPKNHLLILLEDYRSLPWRNVGLNCICIYIVHYFCSLYKHSIMPTIQKIKPYLWFNNQAAEAAQFYTSIFEGSQIISTSPMIVEFQLAGQHFIALNGGPQFEFNESVSFYITCEDQAEVDVYWESLIADGGTEGRCGWLKDKFGLSWQVIPKQLVEFMSDKDREKANRVMQAMMQMKKIVVADLEAAYNQN